LFEITHVAKSWYNLQPKNGVGFKVGFKLDASGFFVLAVEIQIITKHYFNV